MLSFNQSSLAITDYTPTEIGGLNKPLKLAKKFIPPNFVITQILYFYCSSSKSFT